MPAYHWESGSRSAYQNWLREAASCPSGSCEVCAAKSPCRDSPGKDRYDHTGEQASWRRGLASVRHHGASYSLFTARLSEVDSASRAVDFRAMHTPEICG